MADFQVEWQECFPAAGREGALAIGNFDGVHRGHAALVEELRARSRQVGGPAVVLTFDPHPLQLLRPEQFQPALTTIAERARVLHALGADQVLVLRTTPELLRLSAAEFFDQVIRQRLGPRTLVEGFNFGFGRNREGNIETLERLCRAAGLTLTVVPPLELEGIPVSSSRVRDSLVAGAVQEAARLLGRPYRLHGIVETGQGRGQTLGFPTANLTGVATLVPGDGVYAVRVFRQDSTWSGAANVGPNPTFGERARKLEVHLIDFQGNLVGTSLGVDFVSRLRDTRPFAGPAQLIEQLRQDVAQARRITG